MNCFNIKVKSEFFLLVKIKNLILSWYYIYIIVFIISMLNKCFIKWLGSWVGIIFNIKYSFYKVTPMYLMYIYIFF